MAESFDPYHKWLGIPPKDQPPDYYRLLAIPLFESGRQVISHAADQRLAHVRRFRDGEHDGLAQKICDEITEARVCLLSPEKKKLYDELLRQAVVDVSAEPAAGLPPASGPPPLPREAMQDESTLGAKRSRWARWPAVAAKTKRPVAALRHGIVWTTTTARRAIGRASIAAPRVIDDLLRTLAGEGNAILHNFFRFLAIAALVIAAVVLISRTL